MTQTAFVIPADQSRGKAAFALTPLADVMFQLLIFFMLSTSLAPYALLPLGAPAPETPSQTPQAAPTANAQSIWHVSRDQIRIGSEMMPLHDLPGFLDTITPGTVDEVLLFATRAATAQDIATALEIARRGPFPRIRLIGQTASAQP
ncbi:MAG: biopolymer transporter ExbD [Pseudomonadota bacterium]